MAYSLPRYPATHAHRHNTHNDTEGHARTAHLNHQFNEARTQATAHPVACKYLRVNVGPVLQQHPHALHEAAVARNVQGRLPNIILRDKTTTDEAERPPSSPAKIMHYGAQERGKAGRQQLCTRRPSTHPLVHVSASVQQPPQTTNIVIAHTVVHGKGTGGDAAARIEYQ